MKSPYELQKYTVKPLIGIYFLFNDDELVYIGQSIDIDSRVRTHRQEGVKEFDSFSYIEVQKGYLDKVEKAYIMLYCPKYNITHKNHRKPLLKYQSSKEKKASIKTMTAELMKQMMDSPLSDKYWASRANTDINKISEIRRNIDGKALLITN